MTAAGGAKERFGPGMLNRFVQHEYPFWVKTTGLLIKRFSR